MTQIVKKKKLSINSPQPGDGNSIICLFLLPLTFSFDQLSPTWGWKPIVNNWNYFAILLSINSPQPGDGNCLIQLLHSWLQLSINSPQSGDGNFWPVFEETLHNMGTFRSTLPNLGMETLNATPNITVCALSINSPQSGDGNLHLRVQKHFRMVFLSINSPQSGDGNVYFVWL